MSAKETPRKKEASRSSAYRPADVEAKWYAWWTRRDLFRAQPGSGKPPHVIAMPPPNVTGALHMGHALQDTIQDALTRLRRMQGYEALWVPGVDHAGVATQNVVEKELAREGKTRHDLGRERFVERAWAWKREYGGRILEQKRRLGDSCDWSRERFTMDEGFTRAVQEVFVRLYEEGLIYRGDYLVNWDPQNQTALSDEEVDNVERDGFLWHIEYPLADGDGAITVATTRPETMPGDTAVAVHPEDPRYADLVGRTVALPLTDRKIPVIADEYVKMDFGAGALKVTPGHDRNDFEIGQRHGLEVVNVIRPDGALNEAAGPYEGLDRFAARDRIVEDLDRAGLLARTEPMKGSIPVSSRSGAVIEPLVSRQWFVKMAPLAEPAIEAVRAGKVVFHPKRWENEYFRWMENIRDWTISRQLWWGHRIPVWYHLDEDGRIDEGKGYVVSVDPPAPGMAQDEDVLDTWFSSWLWPFATLGWPKETEDLAYFYPTQALVSGYDILFFWIARMIMAGCRFMGEPPYRDIFITGMIKDKQGRWMSKSLGNGVDPLEMIDQYGADAVRFSLVILCAQGQDIRLDPTKFEMGRNFANKIWNAFKAFGRFMEEGKTYRREREFGELELAEQWMAHRLHAAIGEVDEALSRYRLNEALARIYDLFRKDYCDWYLELIKPAPGEEPQDETLALAVELYDAMLRLLHPFMPFVTEELWAQLQPREEGACCMTAPWPAQDASCMDADRAADFDLMQDIVSGVRNIRSEYGAPPGAEVDALVQVAPGAENLAATLAAHAGYFRKLARVRTLHAGSDMPRPAGAASYVAGPCEVFVPLAGLIDLDVERERLRKEAAQKERFLGSVRKKLQNEQFVARARPEVVERERQKERDAAADIARLRKSLENLG